MLKDVTKTTQTTNGELELVLEPADQGADVRRTLSFCRMLDPSCTRNYWNDAGGAFRKAFIIAPVGMKPRALHDEPKVWTKLMKRPDLKVNFLDEAVIVCRDGSWLCDGLIVGIRADGLPDFRPRLVADLSKEDVNRPIPVNADFVLQHTRIL
jgi:hypothetical protein